MAFFYPYEFYMMYYPAMSWFYWTMSMWQLIFMLPFMIALNNLLGYLGSYFGFTSKV